MKHTSQTQAYLLGKGPTEGLEGILQALALLAVGGDDAYAVVAPHVGLLLLVGLHQYAPQLPKQRRSQISLTLSNQHHDHPPALDFCRRILEIKQGPKQNKCKLQQVVL